MILLDTHILVWWINGEKQKLSRKARQALEQHGKRDELLVSSISFFEIVTLERLGRLRFKVPAAQWLANVRKLPEYRLEPLTDDVAERAGQFGDSFPGDPADRLIARPHFFGRFHSSPTMRSCARLSFCRQFGDVGAALSGAPSLAHRRRHPIE